MTATPPPSAMPPVIVEVTQDGYRLSCPALSVTCTAPSVEIGYATLRELSAAAPSAAAGFMPLGQPAAVYPPATPTATPAGAVPPEAAAQGAYVMRGPRNFMPIVVAVLLLPVVIVGVSILNDVRTMIGSVRQLTNSASSGDDQTPQIARAGSLALARAADTIENLTPERQAEMRHNLERISTKLAPIVEGIRPLFAAAGPAAPQQDDTPPSRGGN